MPFDRYHRQMILPGWGEAGQRRLGESTAVVVGCGALGTVIAETLARAGVGRLRIIDRDCVEATNLQRQTLFDEADAADRRPKAVAACQRLAKVNSEIALEPVIADLAPGNVDRLLTGAAVVLDGTDNFHTRYLLNDACVKHGIPLAYGGVLGTRGLQFTILPPVTLPPGLNYRATPCLRCLFPDPPPPGSSGTCDTVGVLAPVAAIVAAAQSVDALKILLGRFDLLSCTLLEFDPWMGQRRRIDLSKASDPGCPCCVHRQFDSLSADFGSDVTVLCGQSGRDGAVQVWPSHHATTPATVNLDLLASRLTNVGKFSLTPWLLRGQLDHSISPAGSTVDLTVFRDGRAVFRGLNNAAQAKALYDRVIGG